MILPNPKVIANKLSVEFGFKKSALNPLTLYYFKKYYDYVCLNDSKSTFKVVRLLFKLDKKLALYLTAHSLFLKGKFNLSLQYLNKLLHITPKHTSAIYLKVKCLESLQCKEEAIAELIKCLNLSNRKKTWLIWANIITTQPEFETYEKFWISTNASTNDWDLINYLNTAALRTKQYDYSLNLLEQTYQKVKLNKVKVTISKNVTPISQVNAELALAQINNIFKKNNIKFFLISGTLLGLIRENRILGHDKDLDIGIWDYHDIQHIKKLIECSGTFEILPIRSPKVLRVRHFSSVCIDIFFHTLNNNKTIHGGVKSVWENSIFELKKANFLNGNYLIPADHDKYLSENYGTDWHIPKVEFDSSLDTPNITITNSYEMIAYCYQKLVICHAQNKMQECEIYLKKIKQHKKLLP